MVIMTKNAKLLLQEYKIKKIIKTKIQHMRCMHECHRPSQNHTVTESFYLLLRSFFE